MQLSEMIMTISFALADQAPQQIGLDTGNAIMTFLAALGAGAITAAAGGIAWGSLKRDVDRLKEHEVSRDIKIAALETARIQQEFERGVFSQRLKTLEEEKITMRAQIESLVNRNMPREDSGRWRVANPPGSSER